mmetsp:Transcript_9057/g.15564  ORF Transcript_9057/g.15564 Transcript_9057/m.15564 type:complete len:199 (+) Transcript_9057:77-673(+)
MNAFAIASTPVGLGAQLRVRSGLKARYARPQAPARQAVVMAKKEESEVEKASWVQNKALGIMLAGAMMFGTAFPDEAMAARSAGRAGGRGGLSSRSQARRAPAPASPSVNRTTNVTVVQTAPPLFGGYGYGMGMGGYGMASPMGGFGFFPMFGFGGTILSFMLFAFVIQVLFSFVTSMFSSRGDGPSNKKDNDSFDDF